MRALLVIGIVYTILLSLLFAFMFSFTGCGKIKETEDFIEQIDEIDGGSSHPAPTAIPIKNPIVMSVQKFGTDGNLWKPESEGGGATYQGNPVILFSNKFVAQFDTCWIPLKNGERHYLTCVDDQPWTGTPYSCFSNGNRQTWRSKVGCKQVAKVEVTCKEASQEIVFTANSRKTCERF